MGLQPLSNACTILGNVCYHALIFKHQILVMRCEVDTVLRKLTSRKPQL